MKNIKLENSKLKAQIAELQNAQDLHGTEIKNSLATLVQGISFQSNLTSFTPLIANNIYAPLTINWTLLTYMYKTHGVLQTAMDIPVLDALRGGLDITSGELDSDDIKDLQDALENRDILHAIGQAMIWARLYGGAALIINTNQNFEEPLNTKKIGEFELYAANRWELTTTSGWKPDTDSRIMPGATAAYAKTDEEYFYFYSKRIHRSRVIIMTGKEAPYIIRWQLAGWGMSEIERMVEDFNSYIKTKQVLYELLEEAKIDVYHMEGLKGNLASGAGTSIVQARIAQMNQLKNFERAIVLDSKDEFDQKQITFSGLAEIMKENRIGIASALRIPMTKLFGLSSSGLNAGEEDIENYNAMVESEIRTKLRQPIRKILMMVCQVLFGYEPDLDFEYKPLRVIGAVEEEAIKTSKQNRYVMLYDRSLLDSKEIGEILEKEALVPIPTAAAAGLLDDHPQGAMGAQGGEEGENEDSGEGEGKTK